MEERVETQQPEVRVGHRESQEPLEGYQDVRGGIGPMELVQGR